MKSSSPIEIIAFSNDTKEYIKTLNIEWLEKYFKIEPRDEKTLSNPQVEIIDKGGMIFYAKYQDVFVGTVSLLKITDSCYELSKMAVTDGTQGLGIGKKLLEHCLEIAKKNRILTLILYSNRKLLPAIHLYEKYGFVAIPLEEGVYERADIKMEKNIEYHN